MSRSPEVEELQVPVLGISGGGTEVPLSEWSKSFGGPDLEFRLYRVEPITWPRNGRETKIAGHLDTSAIPFTEEGIRQTHGGGKYRMSVAGHNPKTNKYGILDTRVLGLSGDPLFPATHFVPSTNATGPVGGGWANRSSEDPSLAGQAMQMAKETAEREQARADRLSEEARTAGRLDTDAIAAITEPYKTQIGALNDRIRSMEDSRRREEERPRETAADTLVKVGDAFGQLANSSNSQIGAVRAQHEAELRTVRENHAAELSRMRASIDDERRRAEDRAAKDMDSLKASHDREIRSLEKSKDSERAALETAKATEIRILDNRIKDLDRMVDKLERECSELRARKEKDPITALKEAAEYKEAILGLTGGDEKDDEDEGVVKMLIKELGGPIAGSIASRIVNPAPPMVPRRRRPMPPHMQRQQGQAGPQGQQGQAGPQGQQGQAGPQGQQGQAGPQGQQGQAGPQGQPPRTIRLDPAEVSLAVQWLESSVANGAKPEVVAESARAMVPAGILAGIQQYGIERFLVEIAKVPPSSNLLSVAGKKFLRRLYQALTAKPRPTLPAAAPQTEPVPVQTEPVPAASIEDGPPEDSQEEVGPTGATP